jgi:hypothetical protein
LPDGGDKPKLLLPEKEKNSALPEAPPKDGPALIPLPKE